MIRKNGNYFCDKIMRQNNGLGDGLGVWRSQRMRALGPIRAEARLWLFVSTKFDFARPSA
jgi:hypothetical protein